MAIIYTKIKHLRLDGKAWAVMIDGVIICYCADAESAMGLLG